MLPGDQHRMAGMPANPFAERAVSPYTAMEIATLQAKLDQQLGPEFISSRPGAGGKKVHYIQADKCINLANQVFGFNGWSSSITNTEVDFLDSSSDGKWSIGVAVTVRVTLKDGTFHEDIGYGQMENGKKAQVFEKAKKEGTTDGLKRALRSFGNVLGNCLYDKDYLAKVTRVRASPTVFDEKRLHRHGDKMQPARNPKTEQPEAKQEPAVVRDMQDKPGQIAQVSPEPFDEYGGDEFEELGIFGGDDTTFDDLMPDEVTTDVSPVDTPSKPGTGQGSNQLNNYGRSGPAIQQPTPALSPTTQPPLPRQPAPRGYPPPPTSAPLRPQQAMVSGNQQQAQAQPGQQEQSIQRPQAPQQLPRQGASRPMQPPAPRLPSKRQAPPVQPQNNQPAPQPTAAAAAAPVTPQPQGQTTPASVAHNPPVGFYTGRAAMNLNGENDSIPEQAPAFDPHRPTTIARSAGIDHTKSSPVARKTVQGQTGTTGTGFSPPNFQNPSLTPNRQIGMPPSRGSGPFRAPGLAGMKRGPPDSRTIQTIGNGRPALGAASGPQLNAQSGGAAGGGGGGGSANDAKRARN